MSCGVENVRLASVAIRIFSLIICAHPAAAGITASGDIDPAYDGTDPWIIPGDLMIAKRGTAAMTVLDGGTVTSLSASIGDHLGGQGSVVVQGAGSLWQNQGALYVGNFGQGELTISEGGRVESDYLRIAFNSSEPSHVTVTGTDSLLQLIHYVDVGKGGRLDISEGGQVTSFGGGGSGTVQVTGPGSTWVNSYWLGLFDDADLMVSEGGLVSSGGSALQPTRSNTSRVIVTGAGSLWDNPGELRIGYTGDASLLISDGGHVVSSGAFVEAQEGGTAVVTVTGANSRWTNKGTLTLGDFFYSGPAAIYDPEGYGTITVSDGGVVETDDMIVWEGSVLAGDGTFKAMQITNHGIIRPGKSIGTLTIDGNLTMDSNSVLEVQIDNRGNSDKVVVSGEFTPGIGHVKPVPTETISGQRQYTVAEAGSILWPQIAVLDQFNTALVHSYLTRGSPEEPDVAILRVMPMPFDDPSMVQTNNQRLLGSALQQIAEQGGNAVTLALQQLDTQEQVCGAYDQLSGQTIPSLAPVTVAGGTRHLGMISGRLRSPAGGAGRGVGLGDSSAGFSAGTDTLGIDAGRYLFALGNGTGILGDRPWGIWGKGYGLYGDRESEAGVPGYEYTIYGTSLGLDYRFTEHLLVGLTGCYSEGDIDHAGSRDGADIATTYGGLYGSYGTSRWYLDSILTYAGLDYETRRYVDLVGEQLEGETSGDLFSGYIEAGLNRWWSVRTLIQPLAALQISTVHIDGFTESGGVSSLSFDEQRYESYRGSLGVKLIHQLFEQPDGCRAALELRGRWVHEFGDTRATVDAGFASDPAVVFRISDEAISRDSAVLGAGLDAWFTRRTRLSLDYGTELNADHTIHVVSAGLEHRW